MLGKAVRAIGWTALGMLPPGIIVVGLYLSSLRPVSAPELGLPCVAAEEAFAARLAKDPLIAQAPPGMIQVYAEHGEPCTGVVDKSANIGGAYATYAYPERMRTVSDVYGFYRQVGQANGWKMISGNQLCGTKVIEGRHLIFLLTQDGALWEGKRPVYGVEIRYEGIGGPGFSCED